MNIDAKVTDTSELRDLFDRYSQDEQTISLQSLQKLAIDCKFTVPQSEIQQFFDHSDRIDFVEFAQFIRHQETTLKRLFRFIDHKHEYSDLITIPNIKTDIELFNDDTTLHYYWSIDPFWVEAIFKGINERRSLPTDKSVTYLDFRKEALLSSTPSAQRYFDLHSDISNFYHKRGAQARAHLQTENDIVFVPGVRNEELQKMFDKLSRGKGFIDIKTLFVIAHESGIPVSEHQIMRFFIACDINEDNKIDFFEFCHFIRSEEEAIRVLFDELDLDETGYLSVDEIKRSFHIKYIKEHKGTLNEQLRHDMDAIDDWINSVVGYMPKEEDEEDDDQNIERRIYYDDFRTYAILSGARNLLNMIRLHDEYKNTPFIYDFDAYDIYTVSDDEYYYDESITLLLNVITFLSGTLAGIVSRTVTAPIDRVKLFMQLKSHGSIGSHVSNIMNEFSSNTLDQTQVRPAAIRKPRIFAFWRGNLTNCIKMAPETAIKFTAHRMLLKAFREMDNGKHDGYHLNFIAGAAAGAISQTCIYPLEIAKTRLALSKYGQYRNFIDCIASIYRYEGGRALYKGWNASVTGIIPYCAMEMGVFFTIKDKWTKTYGNGDDLTLFTLFTFGACASLSGTIVAYPFQLVRTKLQTQGMPGNKYQYNGLAHCFKTTWRKFGIFGLYSGIIPNFAKSIPATCLSYIVVEKTKQLLKNFANID